MNNFGELLGNTILSDHNHIYTYSNNNLLFFEASTLHLIQKVKLNDQILQIGLNEDIYVLSVKGNYYKISIDGKILSQQQHNLELTYAQFNKDHFITFTNESIIRINKKIVSITEYDCKPNLILYYLPYPQSLLIVDQNNIFIHKSDTITHLTTLQHDITCITSNRLNDLIACGDIQGKLFLFSLNQNKLILIRQEQWHAHKIQCILFAQESIFTAGLEGVVVQWHLSNQERQYYPRQGGQIVALNVTQDQGSLLVSVSKLNQIKQISLVGNNVLPQFNGIQMNSFYTQFISYQNKIIGNAIPGQLQIINPLNGQFVSNINVCQKNYVSDIDSSYIRDIKDITNFQLVDKYLICLVQSSITHTLQFYENTHNYEFQLSTLIHLQDYFNHLKIVQDQDIFVITYNQQIVKLWKQQLNSKGISTWNCVYNGSQFKANILNVYFQNNLIIILTQFGLQFIDIISNSLEKEIILDLNDDSLTQMDDQSLIIANQGKIQLFTISSMITKTIATKFSNFLNIQIIDKKYVIIEAELNENKYALICNLKKQAIQQIVQLDNTQQKIYAFLINNKYLIYTYDQNSNQFSYIISFEGDRKASMMIEEQQITEIEQQDKEEEFNPQISTTNTNDSFNLLKRHIISRQYRQIQNLKIADYMSVPSTQLPNLKFIQQQVVKAMQVNYDQIQQESNFAYDKEIEVEIDIKKEGQQMDINKLKQLFKMN